MHSIHKLHYISQGATLEEQESNILRVLDNGVKWIQVRWKNASKTEFLELAHRIKRYCDSYEAICIINDHVDIAALVDADGVHLGLQDSSIHEAKQQLGAEKIVGGTANTLADVRQRIAEGCNYIGVGPLRFTPSKEKLSPILGMDGYRELFQQLSADSDVPPIIAIGGVELDDVAQLQQIGLYGIAVSSLITHRPDLIKNINSLLQ